MRVRLLLEFDEIRKPDKDRSPTHRCSSVFDFSITSNFKKCLPCTFLLYIILPLLYTTLLAPGCPSRHCISNLNFSSVDGVSRSGDLFLAAWAVMEAIEMRIEVPTLVRFSMILLPYLYICESKLLRVGSSNLGIRDDFRYFVQFEVSTAKKKKLDQILDS